MKECIHRYSNVMIYLNPQGVPIPKNFRPSKNPYNCL